jgi:hypothetical protein
MIKWFLSLLPQKFKESLSPICTHPLKHIHSRYIIGLQGDQNNRRGKDRNSAVTGKIGRERESS